VVDEGLLLNHTRGAAGGDGREPRRRPSVERKHRMKEGLLPQFGHVLN
jgi:hypothetical protein